MVQVRLAYPARPCKVHGVRPTHDAFATIPRATIDSLKTDSTTLTKILTYHVAPGRVAPQNINGTRKTVEGGTVTVTGARTR